MLYAKLAIALAVILAAYWKGYSDEHERFLKFQAEVAALGKAQELANQNAIQLAEVITESVKENYETQIASLRAKYANTGRVCNPNSSGGNLPKNPKSTAGAYEPTTDPKLIMNCAMTTAQLVSLQKWISKQIEVNHGQ